MAQPQRKRSVTTLCKLVGMVVLVCSSPIGSATMSVGAEAESEPSFIRDVQPLLRKYCGGCHNEADKEGDFSVASFDALLKGTPEGAVIKAGDLRASRIVKLLHGNDEPRMPPEEEAQPTPAEIALLEKWISAGAKNDAHRVPLSEQLIAPSLAADPQAAGYITAMIDAGDRLVAVARGGHCELSDARTQQVHFSISDLPGKINQLRLSPDGKLLLISTGIAGVGGQVVIVDIAARSVVGNVQGHSDAIYCAAMSPDGELLATGSYDRTALLWKWRDKQVVRRLAGHNGAIYDLDIDGDGKMLATASADQTVKLWGLSDGARLDTLGQPEGEMLCVRFAPDGKHVLASGADRQLRLWEIVSKDRPAINPLRISRFAHEEPVTQIVFRGTDQLVSLSEDRTVKLWALDQLKPLGLITKTGDLPTGVAKCSGDSRQLLVADYSGSLAAVTLPRPREAAESTTDASASAALQAFRGAAPEDVPPMPTDATLEAEPNNRVDAAQAVTLPARIAGKIAAEADGASDVDLFAFDAQGGVPWVIEVNAARSKSPLDSLVDVLDEQGSVVLRTRLQAVRETYFTFRGKDSSISDDFRMHKWQEMELNELLYASGEVVKLWLYPRGPDSGFKVYPGFGARHTFFDTTPTSHALGEIAYIVRELAPGEEPLPNGLPLFPLYYQNDDDGKREWGKDSRLNFTAPRAGRYILRIRDARGFSGEDFKYEVLVRPQRPDFELEIKNTELAMPIGSGREWQVTAKRLDDLDAPIEIRLDNVPEGFVATNPLVIEAGQHVASGNLFATPAARLPEGQDTVAIKLTAVSQTAAGQVVHEIEKPLSVRLKSDPEVQLKLVDARQPEHELEELVIRPGQTISARVIVERHDHKGPIAFGKDDAGRNLPHGAFVDNVGLNGLLITDSSSEREFFITAAPWLSPQERLFHLRSETKNNPTSRSIRLRVLPK